MSKYTVKLNQGYPFEVRRIAGLVIDANGYEGELTEDQVKELKADTVYLTVAAIGGSKPAAKPATPPTPVA